MLSVCSTISAGFQRRDQFCQLRMQFLARNSCFVDQGLQVDRKREVTGRWLRYFMLAAQEIGRCETHLFGLARNTCKAPGIISIPGSTQLSDTGMTYDHLLCNRPSWEGFRKKAPVF